MQENECTEEAFVEGITSPDSNGWLELLYDCFSSTIYGVIGQMVGYGEPAEDALQEVFVKIWKKAPSYKPEKGRVYTWIISITRNHCIDILRSKRNQNESLTSPLMEEQYKSSYEWDPSILGLREVIEKLPKEQADLIRLVYFKGYTQQEISDEFNVPLGTVKSRIRLAMKKLRTILEFGYE
jgi:RNA polymerase sigma factor (sigma-70 family)